MFQPIFFLQGKLLFCHPPPGMSVTSFNAGLEDGGKSPNGTCSNTTDFKDEAAVSDVKDRAAVSGLSEFDKQFLQQVSIGQAVYNLVLICCCLLHAGAGSGDK